MDQLLQSPSGDPVAHDDAGLAPDATESPSRFGRISLAEMEAHRARPALESFDTLMLARAGSIALAEIERANAAALDGLVVAAPGQSDLLTAFRKVVDLQNRRIADLTGLVYLLDRQLNVYRRPLHEVFKVDPLPHTHLSAEANEGEPPRRVTLLASDRQFIGRNWYAGEGNGGETLRWSGPDATSTVLVPTLGGGRLHFAFRMWSPPWIDIRFHVSARIGRLPLELVKGQEDGWWVAEPELPETSSEEYEVLSFSLRIMESPASMGTGPDERKLGIAVSRIEISKA